MSETAMPHNSAVAADTNFPIVHSVDSPIAERIRRARKLAAADAPVLITGETGTGKECFARLIHDSSTRSKGPFVAVNCAAIPESLLESELFGHVKGAFTGAVNNRRGRLELARGGTLLLDEIGDMPLSLQPKLLRVLQEMTFEPIGSSEAQRADFRIIAATHRDLATEVREGRFRADLFYRLHVLTLDIPPLRSRGDDVLHLASYFAKRHAQSFGCSTPSFDGQASKALCMHRWPGNVRELENIIYRAVVLAEDNTITAELIAPATERCEEPLRENTNADEFHLPEEGVQLPDLLQKLEKTLILQALRRTNGNRARAANLLGLNRTTLVEKLRKSGVHEDVEIVAA